MTADSTDRDRVVALEAERRALNLRQCAISEEIERLVTGAWNGWYRWEAHIWPAVVRPVRNRQDEQYGWTAVDMQGNLHRVYSETHNWDTNGKAVPCQPDEAYEYVYKTRAAALQGSIGYCLWQLHKWQQMQADLEARLLAVEAAAGGE